MKPILVRCLSSLLAIAAIAGAVIALRPTASAEQPGYPPCLCTPAYTVFTPDGCCDLQITNWALGFGDCLPVLGLCPPHGTRRKCSFQGTIREVCTGGWTQFLGFKTDCDTAKTKLLACSSDPLLEHEVRLLCYPCE